MSAARRWRSSGSSTDEITVWRYQVDAGGRQGVQGTAMPVHLRRLVRRGRARAGLAAVRCR